MAAVPGSSKGGVSGGGEGDVAREVSSIFSHIFYIFVKVK